MGGFFMTSFSKKLVACAVLLGLVFLAVPYFIARVLEPNTSQEIVIIEPVFVAPSATSLVQIEPRLQVYMQLGEIGELCPFERYLVGVVADYMQEQKILYRRFCFLCWL
jgi:hypothetical protein